MSLWAAAVRGQGAHDLGSRLPWRWTECISMMPEMVVAESRQGRGVGHGRGAVRCLSRDAQRESWSRSKAST